jgi:hypothetical protein
MGKTIQQPPTDLVFGAGAPFQWFDLMAPHNRPIPLNLVGVAFVIVNA